MSVEGAAEVRHGLCGPELLLLLHGHLRLPPAQDSHLLLPDCGRLHLLLGMTEIISMFRFLLSI